MHIDEILPKPFNQAYKHGGSIDYISKYGNDHIYVEKLGYCPEMHSDCSISAKGLAGISLTSYGDWGTVFTSWLDENSQNIFFDMVKNKIIKLWRISQILNDTMYNYNDGSGWTYYDKELGWLSCKSPYNEK